MAFPVVHRARLQMPTLVQMEEICQETRSLIVGMLDRKKTGHLYLHHKPFSVEPQDSPYSVELNTHTC
jgi:hypothetical protein